MRTRLTGKNVAAFYTLTAQRGLCVLYSMCSSVLKQDGNRSTGSGAPALAVAKSFLLRVSEREIIAWNLKELGHLKCSLKTPEELKETL